MKRPAGLSDAEWTGLQAYAKRRNAVIDAILERVSVGSDVPPGGLTVREALIEAYDEGNKRKARLLVPPQ